MSRKLIDPAITILATSGHADPDKAKVELELHDRLAGRPLLKITMSAVEWVTAMSRLGYVDCDVELLNIELANKKMEHRQMEFMLSEDTPNYQYGQDSEFYKSVYAQAERSCPEGWVVSAYFQSQDSFFNKDGQRWARGTIRRWVDVEEENEQS